MALSCKRQNMTVMPNFRLSEQDARDIATSSSPLSPPSYASADYVNDPNLKEKGRYWISSTDGGCHEIRGFEEEQRIGKELTVEGATPIERLDFALQTHHAEEGLDPLKLRPDQKEEKPWYNHKGFFEHKITQPSIYDEGKEKDQKDRLRMPQPYLTPEWRVALTTFLLGSVGTRRTAQTFRARFSTISGPASTDIQNGWWVIGLAQLPGLSPATGWTTVSHYGLAVLPTPEGKDLLPRLTSEGARVDLTCCDSCTIRH